MVVSLILLCLLIGVAIAAAIVLRRWLVAGWIFALLAMPLVRIHVAGAPIYLYDVLGGLLALQILHRRGSLSSGGVFPWHWVFIALGFASTAVAGALFYGFHPQQLWIWGHYSMSCLPILFAVTVRNDRSSYFSWPLKVGLVTSLLALGCISVIQYFDLPGNVPLRDFLYGGLNPGGVPTSGSEYSKRGRTSRLR